MVDKGVSLSYMHQGHLRKLGGWGFPIYDMGGEYWLGLMAVRHTIEAQEGFQASSALSRSILSKYDMRLEKLIEFCIKSHIGPNMYCQFSDQLLHAYFSGDSAAKAILTEGFSYVSRAIDKVDQTIGIKASISLNGSLAPLYKPFLESSRLISDIGNSVKTSLLADIARTGQKI